MTFVNFYLPALFGLSLVSGVMLHADNDSKELLSTASYKRLAGWVKRVRDSEAEPDVVVANGTLFVDDAGDALVELGFVRC